MIGRRPREGTLVVQTAYLGNVVLTTPLLAVLAERHGPVDVVAQPGSASVLEGHPAVHSVIPYDKRGADRGWPGITRLARELRTRRHARAFLADGSWRAATLAMGARIPARTGFAGSPAARLYTERVTRPLHGHETAKLAALAGAAVGEPLPKVCLGLGASDREAAGAWLADRGVSGDFVALAPGSVWGARRWPHYPAFAATLELPVVVIGGPADAPRAQEIAAAAAPGNVRSAAGEVGPRVAAAIIEQAQALVTNDSAALHLATAVGTPIVALFGPTAPSFGFGPLGPRDIVLGLGELLCRPCTQLGPAVCPLEHHRCLVELELPAVAAALASIMQGEETRRAVRAGD
jgi:heptosyltransferase-2